MQRPKPLLDRITALRDEIDKLIDRHADEMMKESPGVPHGVLRMTLTNRAPGCQCRQAIVLCGMKDPA